MTVGAKVTLDLEQWDAKREEVRRLQGQVQELQQQVDKARLAAGGPMLLDATEALLSAFVIVQFAVGTMHPLTVRGWPYQELEKLAELLPRIPGASHIAELSSTFGLFAKECKRWEDARREGREHELLAEENERGISAGALESLWGAGPTPANPAE